MKLIMFLEKVKSDVKEKSDVFYEKLHLKYEE